MKTLVAIDQSRYMTLRTAAIVFAASGFAAFSRFFAYGIGTSAWCTRITGASSSVEAVALDVVHDLRADAAELPAFLEHDGAIGLFNRRGDRLDVHRTDRAQIDDVDVDAFLRQLIGGLHRRRAPSCRS